MLQALSWVMLQALSCAFMRHVLSYAFMLHVLSRAFMLHASWAFRRFHASCGPGGCFMQLPCLGGPQPRRACVGIPEQ
eukprot:scaffold69751_cov19-Tisochrysis_lutea.AAC.2